MPPSDTEDSSSSCGLSSIDDDDGCSDIDKLSKEDKENDEAGSQVTLSTMGTYDSVDVLTPGGLNSFSAALPVKPEKLVLKNLPQFVKISTLTKKNYRVVVKMLNQGIESLKMTSISENNSARSIHNTAKDALKWGTKTVDDSAKKMNMLNDDLTKTNAKLTDATEKMRKATIERDTAVSKKKTAMTNLATKTKAHKKVKKELSDTKKELANAKKEVKNFTWQLQQADFRPSRGDSVDCYCEKESIYKACCIWGKQGERRSPQDRCQT
jgi:hypothetical protein